MGPRDDVPLVPSYFENAVIDSVARRLFETCQFLWAKCPREQSTGLEPCERKENKYVRPERSRDAPDQS